MNPVFSIVIPTYNRGRQLLEIVGHLKLQKFQGWELIVVDDSTDPQEQRASALAAAPGISYYHRGERLGVSSARNFATGKATGQYLAFLDDDDRVSETWLQDFLDLISTQNNPDVLFCGMQRVNAVTLQYGELVLPSARLKNGKQRGIVIPGAFIIRRDFFLSIGGYDERISFGENTELFLRVRAANAVFASTDNVNFFYHQSIDGLSQNLENIIASNKIVLQKHQNFFAKNKRVERLFTQVMGVSFLRLRRFREAQLYLLKAYLLNPFRIKGLLRLIVSYFPILSEKIYARK